MNHLQLKIEVYPGTEIRVACEEIKRLSIFLGEDLHFYFNGILMTTEGYSINDMVDNYLRWNRHPINN